MGLRSAVALDDGLDEAQLDAARNRDMGRLSRRQAAALTVAQAFLTQPASLDAPQWDAVVEQLHPDEVAAVVLRLTQFSRNKVRVALGLDVDEIDVKRY